MKQVVAGQVLLILIVGWTTLEMVLVDRLYAVEAIRARHKELLYTQGFLSEFSGLSVRFIPCSVPLYHIV